MNDLIDKLPKLIAAISFTSIIVFVVHEWAYFAVIGSRFLLLFTVYDFISNSLIWVVPTGVLISLGMFITSTFPSFDAPNEMAPKSISEETEVPLYTKALGLLSMMGITICVFLGSFLGSLSNSTWLLLLVLVVAIIVFAIAYIYIKYDLYKEISKFMLVAIMALIIIAAAVFGHDRAYKDVRDEGNIYNIKLINKDSSKDKSVLRIIEKGIIVFDRSSKQIEFIPLKQVLELKRKMPEPNSETLLCSWFNVYCK